MPPFRLLQYHKNTTQHLNLSAGLCKSYLLATSEGLNLDQQAEEDIHGLAPNF